MSGEYESEGPSEISNWDRSKISLCNSTFYYRKKSRPEIQYNIFIQVTWGIERKDSFLRTTPSHIHTFNPYRTMITIMDWIVSLHNSYVELTASRIVRNKCLLVRPPSLWHLLWQPKQANTVIKRLLNVWSEVSYPKKPKWWIKVKVNTKGMESPDILVLFLSHYLLP